MQRITHSNRAGRIRALYALSTILLGRIPAAAAPLAGVLDLGLLTTAEIDGADRAASLIVMVIAPEEQHGPHLPIATDVIISKAIAEGAAERFARALPDWAILMHPPLVFSPALASEGFAGNATTSPQALADCLAETLRGYAARGFRYCLVIDSHLQPEAQATISSVLSSIRTAFGFRAIQPVASIIFDDEFRARIALLIEDPSILATDIHAGFLETSAMLAIDPALVRADILSSLPPFSMSGAAFGAEVSLGKTMRGMGAVSGYVGSPSGADANFGRGFLDVMADMVSDRAIRLVDPSDDGIFAETRGYFTKIPMQGPSYVFAYPMVRGSAIDGFTPGLLAFGQSNDRVSARFFAGWGVVSKIPVIEGRIALSNFLNPLELDVSAGNSSGSRGIECGLNAYAGYVPPSFRDRPPLRFKTSVRLREALPSAADPLLSFAGPMNSIVVQGEYDPGLKAPLAFSETGIAGHEPFFVRLSYECAPAFMGNARGWDILDCDLRWLIPFAGDGLALAGKTLVYWGGLLWSDGTLPGQGLAIGASPKAFRGYSRLGGNIFSREIMQSLDLRTQWRLSANPLIATIGLALFGDAGFGCPPGGNLIGPSSFRLDAGISLSLLPTYVPMRFRFEYALPLVGQAQGENGRFTFGIGDSY